MIAAVKPAPAGSFATTSGLCVVPSCTRKASTRGVCPACYQVARDMIRSGKTSWAQLEELGLVLPSKRANDTNPLLAAFRQASCRAGRNGQAKANKPSTSAKPRSKAK